MDPDHTPSNRERVRSPRSGFAYCWRCDGARVADGQKCPRCGSRHLTGKRPERRQRALR